MERDLLLGFYIFDDLLHVWFVLRARPIILLKADLSISPEGINLDNKTYTLPDGSKVTRYVQNLGHLNKLSPKKQLILFV